jgi:hypothetical protein
MIHNLDEALDKITGLSDSRLFDIIFGVKTLISIVLFLGLVSAWDTLPSMPPVKEDRSSQSYRILTPSNFEGIEQVPQIRVVVDYKYVVQKLVDFEVHYDLINTATNFVIHDQDRALAPRELSNNLESFQKIFVISEHGRWCLHTKLIWTNGLSIRKHTKDIPPMCFEV